MARVKFTNHYHSGDGYRRAGEEITVSKEEAESLVKAGVAEVIETKKSAAKEDKGTATITTKEQKPAEGDQTKSE